MTGSLQFKLRELTEEVELMRKLAANFLDESTAGVLENVAEQLETLQYRREAATVSVSPAWPIKTNPCKGGYERGSGGTHKGLFAELVFQWRLRPLGDASKKRQASRRVEVAGIGHCFSSVDFDQESWVGVVTSCWMLSKRSVRGAMERRGPTR